MKRNSTLRFFFLVLIPIILLLTRCGTNTSTPIAPQAGDFALLNISHSPRYDYGFKTVGTQNEQSFTISNIGKLTASEMSGSFYLSISFTFKDGSYPGTGGSCGNSLASGASCTIVVVFAPTEIGPAEAPVTISYHNGIAATSLSTLTVAGTGN